MLTKRGFTLVELLIVIGVIAILAALAFVFLNPLARFQDSRNAKRGTDAYNILSAIKLDQVDNGGTQHPNIVALTDEMYYQIGQAGSGCNVDCTGVTLQAECADLGYLVDEKYLVELPIDPGPQNSSLEMTGYYIAKLSTGITVIGSCHEEAGSGATTPTIEVSR